MKSKISLLLILLLFIGVRGYCQVKLQEIVVTGTRSERSLFWTPRAINLLSPKDLERASLYATTTPEMLREATGIFAQVTTPGQGSPLIRNLTGYHTLLMVDGVRLNNSTFRSGPNQYLATVPAISVRRIEVLRSSGSSLYGSSAMGGVINVFTIDPPFSDKGWAVRPLLFSKLASANRERSIGFGLEGSSPKLAFSLEGAFRDVGDVHPGKGADIHFKTRKFIITSDPSPKALPEGAWVVDVESPTNWKGYTADAKVKVKLGEGEAKLGYQLSRQPEVPRYDKVSTKQYEIYLFYPQNRDMVYLKYKLKPLSLILSYHRQDEGRKARRKGKESVKRDTVHTIGISAQILREISKHRLIGGVDFYLDRLDSWSETKNLKTGEVKRANWGRFPDGSSFWDLNFFSQLELKITDRLQAVLGGRFTHYKTKSDLSLRDPMFGMLESSKNALTGDAEVIFNLIEGLNLYASVAQGFRAPSLNDTTAVEVTNEGIDAPNPDIGPERSLSLEAGIKLLRERLSGSVALYQLKVSDLVARVPVTEYFGKEMPEFYRNLQAEHPGIDIFVHTNLKETVIRGIESEANLILKEGVSLYGNFMFTRGRKPLRREQPLRGMIGLLWEPNDQMWCEFFVRAAAKQTRLTAGDRRDPRIPGTIRDPKVEDPQAGTPGWYTLNFRAGTELYGLKLSFALENILNRRYREHGSGVNGLGRNFVISIRR
ncbi:TPA: TonB-dependent receptor [Candidatus Poribacteria bacterium]|nr:TonB-dependent receptor [Candidatus Poribacteria bacterium]